MGISCLLYRNKLAALTSNALPEALAARVERHLQSCPDCLSEWAAQQRMAEALRAASPTLAAPSPFLWERLQSAIEAEAAPRTPARPPLRRLAPLGSLALAGAAAAAILVLRPQVPATTSSSTAPQVSSPASPAPTQMHASLPPSPAPTALELARRTERQVAANRAAPDPFAPRPLSHPTTDTDTGAQLVRRVRRASSVARRPKVLPVLEGELPARASHNAVALVEAGMHRVVEESQTAELNRLVAEAESREPSAAQRASCPATEATVSAQHTQGSLFQ